jgi:hypothetical protein
MGSPVLSTHEQQKIAHIRVYPGAEGDFTLFTDDGTTYAYENGAGAVTQLHWDQAQRRLTHSGTAPWTGPDSEVIEVLDENHSKP